MKKEKIINKLFDIGAVKFGEFILKSGMISPIYIDLRILVSYPKVMEKVSDLIWSVLDGLEFDLIAGIPYAALPIASAISIKRKIPMIFARKEIKDYGTKKKIEGCYQKGDRCIIIDNLITTGDSKLETIKLFESEGLVIKDFAVLIDREQGGKETLEKKGYNLHSIIPITELLNTLFKNQKISRKDYQNSIKFIQENKIT